MKYERREWKSWLKTQHSKTKTWKKNRNRRSWHLVPSLHCKQMGNNENSDRLYFGGLQNHCSDHYHEITRHLLLERKVMTNLDSILKSRVIALPTKAHIVKAMVFPVVMCGCEIWTIKKVECQRINAFESVVLRRLLRVPWTKKRSNQSILKEITPEYWLEVLGKHTDWNRPPWPGTIVTICMRCFMAGDPDKEYCGAAELFDVFWLVDI